VNASFARLLPLSVALTAACGARSMLAEGTAPGAGGATTTTTSTSSSSSTTTTTSTSSTTTTTGVPSTCNFDFPAPIVTVPVPNVLARRPALTSVGGDVALLYGSDEDDPSAPSPVAVLLVQQPWGAWPPNTLGPHDLAPDGGRAFAVAPRSATTFALARTLTGAPEAVLIDDDVDPLGVTSGSPSIVSGQVLALGVDGGRHAVATRSEQAGQFRGGVDCPESFVGTAPTCASAAINGHLFARNGSFFTAITRSLTGACGEAPTVLRLYPSFPGSASVDTDVGETIRRVRVAPRGSGAWVVTQVHVDQPVSFVRVDPILADGTPDPQFGTLHPAITGDTDIDAVALGDKLVLAVIQDQAHQIRVVAVTADGQKGSRDVDAPEAIDEIALLASPDGHTLLVAWTDRQMGNLHITRLGC
jgi:hypothetical protein